MTVQEQIKSHIDASVAALDSILPNWVDLMPENVRKLDVMNADKCILHYAFGDFWHGWGVVHNRGFGPAHLAFTSLVVWEDLSDDELMHARDLLRLAWRDRVTELRNAS